MVILIKAQQSLQRVKPPKAWILERWPKNLKYQITLSNTNKIPYKTRDNYAVRWEWPLFILFTIFEIGIVVLRKTKFFAKNEKSSKAFQKKIKKQYPIVS